MTTFAELLAGRLRIDPGRPLVTYYDLATGERVELSVTTYANWVAKTASLLAEHDLERGQSLRIDLPTHWLGPVFLGAAWTLGLTVTEAERPDAVVCGPGGLERWTSYPDHGVVLACSLRPLGVRFADPLAPGVHDVGVEVWSQPDAFVAWDPPGGTDAAVSWPTEELTQEELWSRNDAGSSSPPGGRVLSTVNPASPAGLTALTGALGGGGSVVLVSLPVAGDSPGAAAEEAVARVFATERCTTRYDGGG